MTSTYNYSERLELLELHGFVQKKGCITNDKYSFLYHQIDRSEMTDEEFTEFINLIKQSNMKPHSFCETPEKKCTMNYCDENGCLNRKRELADEKGQPITYWGGLADDAFERESAINKLAEEVYGKGIKEDYEEGFVDGFNKAKEYLYTKQDLVDLVQGLKDYTKESHTILGHDDREPSEFVDIFLNEISDEEALSLAKELNKQPMTFVPFEISDRVLFEQATVEMEERYGSGCETEIDAYFRGAKWMQENLLNVGNIHHK